jgi:putative two-component system response regulator
MDQILIIDDDILNRKFLEKCFSEFGLHSITAANGMEGLDILRRNHHTIKTITLDIEMPKLNGYQFAEIVKGNEKLQSIPIIFITGKSEKYDILKALDLFAYDYLVKPIDPQFVYYKVRNAVNFYNNHLTLKELNERISFENKVLENSLYIKNRKLNEINSTILNMLETTNHYNDEDTGNHIQRVAEYSTLIAAKYGLSKRNVNSIHEYAPLHDIGKVGVPDSILKKPGKLSKEEFDVMKSHVDIGVELIKNMDLPVTAHNIIKYHHEWWNGQGYGTKLKENDIPIEARIVALADVFDALTTKRCYKDAYSYEKSAGIIKEESGIHFDPKLVQVFFENKNGIVEIMNELKD